jgi:proteasome lid subunit RPN8/RPN11
MIEFLEDIQQHFQDEYPKEGCGLLGVMKGKLKWFPCRNVASYEEDFVMSSEDYINVKKKADIIAVVHSHPNAPCTPSKADIDNCNALGLIYHIFSYPEMELYTLSPRKNFKPLIGREYRFGSSDCFEAMRDYYHEELDINLKPREMFEDDWWERGFDYFSEEFIKTYGFERVIEPQKGDLLIFAVESSVGNHCGVYLGNNIFFHHAAHRLSCRENMSKLWLESLIGVYRYVT